MQYLALNHIEHIVQEFHLSTTDEIFRKQNQSVSSHSQRVTCGNWIRYYTTSGELSKQLKSIQNINLRYLSQLLPHTCLAFLHLHPFPDTYMSLQDS